MYAIGWLDLKADGPTVVDLPTGMLGILDDMGFLYMTDLGKAGPDKGKGGKFLVLPPDHTGRPDGYFVVQSNTNGVWLFIRGNIDNGVKPAADHIRDNLKVYSLANTEPARDGVHQRLRQADEHGGAEQQLLREAARRDPARTRRLPRPGGQGHDGSGRHREGQAVCSRCADEEGLHRCCRDRQRRQRVRSATRRGNPGQFVYEGNKTWVMGYANKETTYTHNGARDLEGRVFFHFGYICVSPAMAVTIAGGGSDYAMAAIDSNGDALDGSKTYKLNVPANPPVNDFWAVTMYDTQTRSQLQTDQQFPTLGSQDKGVDDQRRRLTRHLLRSRGPRRPREELAPDDPRQELVHRVPPVRAPAGLDRPDLATRRHRARPVVDSNVRGIWAASGGGCESG